MFNRKKKGQLGFTLIELLAVVAILGILAGVAVPRVMGVLANARAGANTANIAILQSAVERWGMDNNAGVSADTWRGLLASDAYGATPLAETVAVTGSYRILVVALVPTYATALPSPPQGGAYRIEIRSSGTTPAFFFAKVVAGVTAP